MVNIASLLSGAGVVVFSTLNQVHDMISGTTAGQAAVLKVYTQGCGHSQRMAQPLADFKVKYTSVSFFGIDGMPVQGLTGELDIKGFPTFIGYACGKEAGRVIGSDNDGLENLVMKLKDMKC